MDSEKLKEIFIQFGHYIALGFSICIIAFTLLFGGSSIADGIKQTTEDKITEVNSRRARVRPPQEDVLDPLPMVKQNWVMKHTLEKGPSHDYLYPPAELSFEYEVPPTHQWINTPVNLSVEVGREQLSVSWEEPPGLVDEVGKDRQMSKIAGYILEKKEGKRAEQIIIGESETSYEDEKVESRVDYRYRVCAFTYNIKAKGGETDVVNGRQVIRSKYTNEKVGQIKPLYKIRLKGVGEARGKVAFVEVEKWEKGDWRQIALQIRKNEEIKKETRVKDVGKVNFNPGWTVIAITDRAKVKKVVYTEQIVGFDDEGKAIKKRNKETREERVPAIRYKDDKGKVHTVYQSRNTSKPTKEKEEE